MIRLRIVIIVLIVLQSCGSPSIDPNSFEGRLGVRIKTVCTSSDVCRIRVRDVTSFDWETLYVFKHTATPEEIQKTLGMPIPRYHEFTKKIIFVKAGSVVYSEAIPIDVERPLNGEIVFDIPYSAVYRSYGPESLFTATKKAFSNGEYYELKIVDE